MRGPCHSVRFLAFVNLAKWQSSLLNSPLSAVALMPKKDFSLRPSEIFVFICLMPLFKLPLSITRQENGIHFDWTMRFFLLFLTGRGFLCPPRKNSIGFCSSPDFGEFQFVQTIAFATPHTLRLAFMLEHIERRNPEERGDSRITAEFAFHINSLLIGTLDFWGRRKGILKNRHGTKCSIGRRAYFRQRQSISDKAKVAKWRSKIREMPLDNKSNLDEEGRITLKIK